MDAKIGLIALVAMLAGAVTGGIVTANFVPTAETAGSNSADTDALDAALKDAAEARAEATHWQGEADRFARQLAMKVEKSQTPNAAPVEDFAEVAQSAPSPMDASMREELEEYRARDRERDERSEDRRGQMAEWQTVMTDRRTNMFTELIERTDNPAEQQRWADIEQQMNLARGLMQEMRAAETDEERLAIRGELGDNNLTMQSLLKEQQNAVLQRALEAEGISDAEQVAQIQNAVRTSLSDQSFQLSGRGGLGGGRGRGGPGGGPGRGVPDGGGRGPSGR